VSDHRTFERALKDLLSQLDSGDGAALEDTWQRCETAFAGLQKAVEAGELTPGDWSTALVSLQAVARDLATRRLETIGAEIERVGSARRVGDRLADDSRHGTSCNVSG